MGGTTFTKIAKGANAQAAFNAAREQAQYDHGHAGYTGTIAEKSSFVVIDRGKTFAVKDALERAESLIDDDDPRIVDKWGDAGCLALDDGRYLFFGWASC